MNMFSHAAMECRSAAPLNFAVVSAAALPSLVTGANEVGMIMPSACLAQPCSVSSDDELVSPTSTLGFTPWRCISFSTPQVVNGCAEIATMSALAFFISRTCVEKLVSLSSHFELPATLYPFASARSFMIAYQEARECAKSSSTPPYTLCAFGYLVLSQ